MQGIAEEIIVAATSNKADNETGSFRSGSRAAVSVLMGRSQTFQKWLNSLIPDGLL